MRNNLYLLCICTAGFLIAQSSPEEMIEKMGRGINLGNVLSAPVEGNWSGAATEQYFIDVAEAGFKNVRVPIDFYGYRTQGDTTTYSSQENTVFNGSRSDFHVNPTYLNRIEEVIGWGLEQGLIIVLDFHGANLKEEFIYTFDPGKSEYTHPSSAKRLADVEKFYSIWKQIAERFKDYNDNLIFEVINEPYFHISADEMNQINSEVISIIRSSGSNNSTRKIIITGGSSSSYQAPLEISNSILNNDDYLIATFHYYRPFNFTKSSDDNFDDNNWGSISDKNNIDNEFNVVKSWAESFNPNVAVYLGEFGADNAYGYNYSTGDLLNISSNNSGYADGGPDPNSRADYHSYVANAAIDRGFAFSAWDAGGKSSKTIHLRKDSNLVVYDFDEFRINSFVPKQTYPSTIIESDIWVEKIKNALLSNYSELICNDVNVLKNIDFECGINNNWSFQTFGNIIEAAYEDASFNSIQGSHGAKISVYQANNFNSAILSNEIIENNGELENKQIRFTFYAKGSSSLGFKVRIKYVQNGTNKYSVSPLLLTETSYQENPYEFLFNMPTDVSSIQFQIICGANEGTYYFDEFNAVLNTFSNKKEYSFFELYPNPVKNVFHIQGDLKTEKVLLFDLNGRKIMEWKNPNRTYDISNLKNGIYFIEIHSLNNLICYEKILKI